jgi:hypothetical protein
VAYCRASHLFMRFSGFSLLIVVTLLTGCGGGAGTPTGPSGMSGVCRNYASSVTSTTTSTFTGMNPIVDSQYITISYNTATNQLSEIGTGTSNTCQWSFSWSTNYGSVADFVDEVSVIPPKTGWASQSGLATSSGPSPRCPNETYALTQTNSYDSQGRLLRSESTGREFRFRSMVATFPGTRVYTAWDLSGRPTNYSPRLLGSPDVYRYDDSARTRSTVGGLSTAVDTFDSNGNLVRSRTVSVTPPPVLSGSPALVQTWEAIFAIDATARVCR